MQTIKLRYEANENDKKLILSFQKQFSNCLHVMFNRLKESKSLKECRDIAANLNNIELLDSWMRVCALGKAQNIWMTSKNVIFGGKSNFIKRCQGKISKDEFKKKKIEPLWICGEATHYHGNRKFRIQDNLKSILFKPNKKIKIYLNLPSLKKNYKKILKKLCKHAEIDDMPITFSIDQEHVRISFDESKVFEKKENIQKKNRVLAIDLNPNYIGWSIVNWHNERDFDVVKTGCYSFKFLNDKQFALKLTKKQKEELDRKERLELTNKAKTKNIYFNNKRNHEMIEVAKDLMNVAKQCQCEIVVCEDLNIKSQDRSKGKKLNRLCNSFFIRNAFINNLNKRCNMDDIKFLKVIPSYSSFIGNFLYRGLNLPDPILASIELGRRGYEFNTQYIEKSKEKSKTIVQPSLKKFDDLIHKSLEEFGIKESFKDLIDLYYLFKKDPKMMYRVPFAKDSKWSKLKTKKSYISKLDGFSLSSLQF